MSDIKKAIFYGRELFIAGINSGSNGNISFRDKDRILITKSNAILSQLSEKDFVEINSKEASSENPAHRIIYENDNEINSVFHVHSVNAIAYSLKTIDDIVEPIDLEGKYHFEQIPIIETELIPGAPDLPDKLLENYKNKAVIVRGHGVFIFGKSIEECYLRAVTIDNICKIILLS